MSKSQPSTPTPNHEEIAGRAYQRYLERGSQDGYDVEDWLAAEQELTGQPGEQQNARRPRLSKSEAA